MQHQSKTANMIEWSKYKSSEYRNTLFSWFKLPSSNHPSEWFKLATADYQNLMLAAMLLPENMKRFKQFLKNKGLKDFSKIDIQVFDDPRSDNSLCTFAFFGHERKISLVCKFFIEGIMNLDASYDQLQSTITHCEPWVGKMLQVTQLRCLLHWVFKQLVETKQPMPFDVINIIISHALDIENPSNLARHQHGY